LLTTNRNLVPKNPDGTYARKFLDIMRDKNADGSPVDPDKLDPATSTTSPEASRITALRGNRSCRTSSMPSSTI